MSDRSRFVKMQGLGNDFIVLEGPDEPTNAQITAWCSRRTGIGADGVLLVTAGEEVAVRMRYWNADGGLAEMCGNGLRCVARYCHDRGWVDGSSFTIETDVGPRRVMIIGDEVRAELGPVVIDEREVQIDATTVRRVDVGNPHAVLFVDDVAGAPVAEVGSAIERAVEGGTNVEFARMIAPGIVEVRTWERGVGETHACGTGALAAGAVAQESHGASNPVVIRLRGGDAQVEVAEDSGWITGPATYVYEGFLPDTP